MRSKRYEQVYDGDWMPYAWRGNKMACCHCGLVHKINFRIKHKTLEVQVSQDKRATAAVRRKKSLRSVARVLRSQQ